MLDSQLKPKMKAAKYSSGSTSARRSRTWSLRRQVRFRNSAVSQMRSLSCSILEASAEHTVVSGEHVDVKSKGAEMSRCS